MNGVQEAASSSLATRTKKYRDFSENAEITVLFSPVAFCKVAGKIRLLHTYYTLHK